MNNGNSWLAVECVHIVGFVSVINENGEQCVWCFNVLAFYSTPFSEEATFCLWQVSFSRLPFLFTVIQRHFEA